MRYRADRVTWARSIARFPQPGFDKLSISWAIALAVLVNAASMLTPIVNAGDSVTYAALAQHMVETGNWVNLVLDSRDWLDKPHFPFWVTALCFKLFGINAFAYILPGFLFHLVGGYFTYRIGRLLFGRDSALLALLVYVSTFQLMDMASTVKAEAFLTGSITAACFYWLRFDADSRFKHLLLGAIFSAIAVMTKGIFTLITLSSGMVCMWLYQRQFYKLYSAKWLLALTITVLFTGPEVAALYWQFDSQPDKLIFGHTHVSGIRFFLWDSQFGRFFNSGPIKNEEGNPWYFLHVFLWTFLPWVGVFFMAMKASVFRSLAQDSAERGKLVFLAGSFGVTFALFSATKFQLDYYAAIVYPFAAILCGRYLAGWFDQNPIEERLSAVQLVVTGLILALTLGLAVYVSDPLLLCLVLLACGLLLAHLLWKRQGPGPSYAVLVYPVVAVCTLYAFLESMTFLAFSVYSVPYNVNRLLQGLPQAPIVAYQLDEIVARELNLYGPMPCTAVSQPDQLPPAGHAYYLVIREVQLLKIRDEIGPHQDLAHGMWVDHKTGILPRTLRLAKGVEPLESVHLVKVGVLLR